MSSLALITLFFPNISLNDIWKINPKGHEGFQRIGNWSFLVLSSVMVACATCAYGLWFKKAWGYWLALCLVIMNLIGDVVNILILQEYRAAIGIPVAVVLLWLLRRANTQTYFSLNK
jgi:hypothetical protein